MKKTVGILIFDDAEVLDFAGPFEVFSVTSQINDNKLLDVFTVAKTKEPVIAVNGLSVNPKYDFQSAPLINILIIAGGQGTRKLLQDKTILEWVKKIHENTELTLSICSGTRVLAKLGLLDGKSYCTHHQVYESLQELIVGGFPQKKKRFVKADKIYTSAGISAGIDLSFHIVEQLFGEEIKKQTAEYMEYYLNG